MANQNASLFTGPLLAAAVRDAFLKLNPAKLIKTRVMFVTAIVASLSTVLLIKGLATGTGHAAFEGQLVFWLWLTVLFGNVAEALAEGRGKAQAAALRATKADLRAKKLIGVAGAWEWVDAARQDVQVVRTVAQRPDGMGCKRPARVPGRDAPLVEQSTTRTLSPSTRTLS